MKPSARITELLETRDMLKCDAIIAYLDEREALLHPIARAHPAPASPPEKSRSLAATLMATCGYRYDFGGERYYCRLSAGHGGPHTDEPPASPPGEDNPIEQAWDAGYGTRPRELASERALREERDTLKARVDAWELFGAEISGCTNYEGDAALEDARAGMERHIGAWQLNADTQRERAEKAEARVGELEALFQRTHGVHHSWVAAEETSRTRIQQLEGELAEYGDLVKAVRGELQIAGDACNRACGERDELKRKMAGARAKLESLVQRAESMVSIPLFNDFEAVLSALDRTERERAETPKSCKCGRPLDGFDCNGEQCIADSEPPPVADSSEAPREIKVGSTWMLGTHMIQVTHADNESVGYRLTPDQFTSGRGAYDAEHFRRLATHVSDPPSSPEPAEVRGRCDECGERDVKLFIAVSSAVHPAQDTGALWQPYLCLPCAKAEAGTSGGTR